MKHQTRRVLSRLLSLALALSLLPGLSVTARATDGHAHSFTYSANGATITATCQNDGCSLTENKVTLRIVPNSVLYYNDGQPKEASLEGLDEFNAATGKNTTTDDITYYKGDTNVTAQIKAGSGTSIKGATYTARLDVEGKRATVTFKLTAKPADHVHSFTYTASGNVITATCNQTSTSMAACGLTNKQATLTLNAPEHTTYGDGKAANATFTGEIPGVTNPTINYRRSDTPLSSAPTDAGTYTAWCQLGNATASVEYTIGKATNNGWTTLPQAINNLVYTGQPQDLITAGVPSAGSALYTVGTDPDNEPDVDAGGMPYTGAVPKMTNAGTYYVWCKIDGGKNYTSINAQKVEVTIAKANPTATAPSGSATYGQTLADVTLTNPEGNTPGTWAWADAATTSVGSVGAHTFKANFTPTDTTNYNSKSNVDVTVNVGKADAVTATVTANTLTYNGQEQALVTVDKSTLVGGTMYYAVTTENAAPTDDSLYTTSIPAKTDAGTYYVWYKVVGDANHNDSASACVTTVISPAPSYDDDDDSYVAPTVRITEQEVPLADASAVVTPFADVPADAYYSDAVAWAYANDITSGVSEQSFGPGETCTRGQMVTFLWRAAGCPEPTVTTSTFSDVAAGSYYEKAVAWAVENGITDGVGGGRFDPNGIIDRAQAVTFLYRAKGSPAVTADSGFTDVASGAYYENAVAWAVANGVTDGVGDNAFAPNNNCVRGQTVTFLYRAYK